MSAPAPSTPAPPEPGWLRRNYRTVVLVFLAFGIPELLTGSTSVPGLVLSLNLVLGLPLYGSGVLLVREASLKWNKGWGGVLFLGLAYGIVEEGIATKTMINPSAGAAGGLGTFGHFLGVNWIFAVEIDIFHAIFSIALPILLVSLLWPERKSLRWISDRGLVAALLVLGAEAALGYFVLTHFYFPSPFVLAFLLATIAALVALFFRFPMEWLHARTAAPTARPRQFGFVAGGFVFSLFGLSDLAPYWKPPPVLLVAALLLVSGLVFSYLLARAGSSGNELQKVAFAAGLLSFWVPWDIVLELIGDVGVVVVLGLLYYLLYRLYVRYRDPAVPVGPAGT